MSRADPSAPKPKIKIKEKNSKFVPGLVNLQILGCGATGSPASVYLFTDHSRYLFNCGEGTQRLAHEHKTKLTRLEHIFVTQNNWKCTGGLPGLTLTVQDAGVPNITLHGPPKINEVFKAMRNFVVLKQLNVSAPLCEENGFYDDSVLRISYILLKKASPDTRVDTVMCYLCKLKPRPGALCMKKCAEKGVPKGPILGRLKNGETITLDNGVVVKPEEVCEPGDPGSAFLVIDVPRVDYLECLLNNEKLKECQKMSQGDNYLELILDFSPQSIIDRPEYQAFVKSFPENTKHMVLNESNRFSGYIAAQRLQWQLHQLNEDIFPVLREPTSELHKEHSNSKKIKLEDSTVTVARQISKEQDALRISAMTCYHLRPKRGFDRSVEATVNPDEYIKEIEEIDGFQESLEILKNKMALSSKTDRTEQYPKVIFLGTGSCIPNKNRNVSAILLHISKDTCVLLDVGEGTFGQIYRFYGSETNDILRKLKAIYISHLHADHHIGLFGVLQMRERAFSGKSAPPLILLAPLQISNWLNFYDKHIEPINNGIKLIANEDLVDNDFPSEYTEILDLASLKTCYVRHCPHAFGVALTLKQKSNHEKSLKITYSGDTMPCDNLVKLGESSYLLIHEATMEDELYEDALAKCHSTVSQAIEQGHKMNAKHILLTHFSQRYAKLPRIEQHLVQNIGIAFDNMEVVPTDLDHMNILYPTLRKMFAESWDEMEQKSLKRAQKKAIAEIDRMNS